jgi:hypothetical protein
MIDKTLTFRNLTLFYLKNYWNVNFLKTLPSWSKFTNFVLKCVKLSA